MGVIDPHNAQPIPQGADQDAILKAVGDEITNRGFVIAKAIESDTPINISCRSSLPRNWPKPTRRRRQQTSATIAHRLNDRYIKIWKPSAASIRRMQRPTKLMQDPPSKTNNIADCFCMNTLFPLIAFAYHRKAAFPKEMQKSRL